MPTAQLPVPAEQRYKPDVGDTQAGGRQQAPGSRVAAGGHRGPSGWQAPALERGALPQPITQQRSPPCKTHTQRYHVPCCIFKQQESQRGCRVQVKRHIHCSNGSELPERYTNPGFQAHGAHVQTLHRTRLPATLRALCCSILYKERKSQHAMYACCVRWG